RSTRPTPRPSSSTPSSTRSRRSRGPQDMATPEYALREMPRPQVLTREVTRPPRARWVSWLATTDHKKIGILYMVTAFMFFMVGGLVFDASLFWSPPQAGWTSYSPLSSSAYLPDGGIDAWIYFIYLTGLSSILGAINLYVTILNMRAPGMGWARLPLFCWTILTFAILLILALPSVAAGVTLLLKIGR